MTLTPEERETILRFDDSGDACEVWTASPTVAARLRRAGLAVTQEPGGWRATCAKQAIRIKAGRYSCYVGGR
jgi:hypothetical protein